jgi:hypothetical protein
LEPLTPGEATELWVESRRDELAAATLKLQRFHVEQFTEWLQTQDIDDMRDVTARTVHRFRLEIKGDIEQSTLAQRVSTVRRFLTFCVSIDAVDPSVPERVELPNRESKAREEKLDADEAEEALDYLDRFAYASREHALLALCWHTGVRTGTLRALDVSDVETDEARLRVRHRPGEDTPLKNKVAVFCGTNHETVARSVCQPPQPVTLEASREPVSARAKLNEGWPRKRSLPSEAVTVECQHHPLRLKPFPQLGMYSGEVTAQPAFRGNLPTTARTPIPVFSLGQ